MSKPSILLLGASGYLGVPMVAEFLNQRSKFDRLAILTDSTRVHKFEDAVSKGVELVVGSYFDASSFKGFDTVISLLGNYAMVDQPDIIKACIASGGVADFYPSEFGYDVGQGPFITSRYFVDKNKTRKFLESVVEKNGGGGDGKFNYTLIMCGGFMEYSAHPAFGFDEESNTFTFYGKGEKEEAMTSVPDVCRYTVASTLMPKSSAGVRRFCVPTAWYNWNEVAAMISKTSGIEYKPIYLPNEEAVRKEEEFKKAGDIDGELLYSLKGLMGNPDGRGVPEPWNKELFPDIVPEDLESALTRHFQKAKA